MTVRFAARLTFMLLALLFFAGGLCVLGCIADAATARKTPCHPDTVWARDTVRIYVPAGGPYPDYRPPVIKKGAAHGQLVAR